MNIRQRFTTFLIYAHFGLAWSLSAVGAGAGAPSSGSSSNFQIGSFYNIPSDQDLKRLARSAFPVAEALVTVPNTGLDTDETLDLNTGQNELKLLWSPQTDGDLVWGLGPRLTPGRDFSGTTDDRFGGGMVGALFGTRNRFSYGAVAGHHWGENNLSLTTLQPIVFYNIDAAPGAYVGYNNTITYNWNTKSGDHWEIPLGLTLGRTLPLGNRGHALDLSFGGYGVTDRANGGSDWQLNLGVSVFFP